MDAVVAPVPPPATPLLPLFLESATVAVNAVVVMAVKPVPAMTMAPLAAEAVVPADSFPPAAAWIAAANPVIVCVATPMTWPSVVPPMTKVTAVPTASVMVTEPVKGAFVGAAPPLSSVMDPAVPPASPPVRVTLSEVKPVMVTPICPPVWLATKFITSWVPPASPMAAVMPVFP